MGNKETLDKFGASLIRVYIILYVVHILYLSIIKYILHIIYFIFYVINIIHYICKIFINSLYISQIVRFPSIDK